MMTHHHFTMFSLAVVLLCGCVLNAESNRTYIFKVIVGSTVELKCDSENTSIVHWLKQQNNGTWTEIHDINFFHGINNTLTVEKFTSSHVGRYKCVTNGTVATEYTVETLDESHIYDIECITSNNFTSMRCCWLTTAEYNNNNNNTHYLQYFTRNSENSFHSFDDNEQLISKGLSQVSIFESSTSVDNNLTFCSEFDLDHDYRNENNYVVDIQLLFKNDVATNISYATREYPRSCLKVSTPRQLTLSTIHTNNRYYAEVSWLPPDTFITTFKYKLRYKIIDENTEMNWEEIYPINRESYTIDHIRHNAMVEVQISARPFRPTSRWTSDWTISKWSSTGQLAPFYEMEFSHFTLTWYEDDSHETTVVWDPYVEITDGFYNIIEQCNCSGCIKHEVPGDYSTIKFLHDDACEHIQGSFCNSKGCLKQKKKTILDELGEFDTFNDVSLSAIDSRFNVSWNYQHKLDIPPYPTCILKLFAMGKNMILNDHVEAKYALTTAYMIHNQTVDCNQSKYTVLLNTLSCVKYVVIMEATMTYGNTTFQRFMGSGQWQENILPDALPTDLKDFEFNKQQLVGASTNGNNITVEVSGSTGNVTDVKIIVEKICGKTTAIIKKIVGQFTVFSDLDWDTKYEISLTHCCEGIPNACDVKSGTKLISSTRVGVPDVINNFTWDWLDGEVSWTEPQLRHSLNKGYQVMCSNDEYQMHITSPTWNFRHHCNKHTSGNVSIQGNYELDGELYHSDKVMIYIDCEKLAKPVHTILSAIVSAIIIITIATVVGFCFRRKIKRVFVKVLWPPIPKPHVNVHYKNLQPERLDVHEETNCLLTSEDIQEDNVNLRHEIVDELICDKRKQTFNSTESDNDKSSLFSSLPTARYSDEEHHNDDYPQTIPLYVSTKHTFHRNYSACYSSVPSYLTWDHNSGLSAYKFDDSSSCNYLDSSKSDKIDYSQMFTTECDTISLVSSIALPTFHLEKQCLYSHSDLTKLSPVSCSSRFSDHTTSDISNYGSFSSGASCTYSICSQSLYVKDQFPSYLKQATLGYLQ